MLRKRGSRFRVIEGSDKYHDTQTNKIASVKCIPFDKDNTDGIPSSVLREISVWKELDHANVARLLDVVDDSTGFKLAYEYLDSDLATFIKDDSKAIDSTIIEGFLRQVLRGVSYCHSQQVMHRDLKPESLLLNSDTNELKLAGFGCARTIDVTLSQYSTGAIIVDPKYKAPELLLGYPHFPAVDIWSVGCIFAEMVGRKPLFTGTTRCTVMTEMIRLFGVPSETEFPGVREACLKLLGELPFKIEGDDLETRFPGFDGDGLDLLQRMLFMIPRERITAYEALNHPYLRRRN